MNGQQKRKVWGGEGFKSVYTESFSLCPYLIIIMFTNLFTTVHGKIVHFQSSVSDLVNDISRE